MRLSVRPAGLVCRSMQVVLYIYIYILDASDASIGVLGPCSRRRRERRCRASSVAPLDRRLDVYSATDSGTCRAHEYGERTINRPISAESTRCVSLSPATSYRRSLHPHSRRDCHGASLRRFTMRSRHPQLPHSFYSGLQPTFSTNSPPCSPPG